LRKKHQPTIQHESIMLLWDWLLGLPSILACSYWRALLYTKVLGSLTSHLPPFSAKVFMEQFLHPGKTTFYTLCTQVRTGHSKWWAPTIL